MSMPDNNKTRNQKLHKETKQNIYFINAFFLFGIIFILITGKFLAYHYHWTKILNIAECLLFFYCCLYFLVQLSLILNPFAAKYMEKEISKSTLAAYLLLFCVFLIPLICLLRTRDSINNIINFLAFLIIATNAINMISKERRENNRTFMYNIFLLSAIILLYFYCLIFDSEIGYISLAIIIFHAFDSLMKSLNSSFSWYQDKKKKELDMLNIFFAAMAFFSFTFILVFNYMPEFFNRANNRLNA